MFSSTESKRDPERDPLPYPPATMLIWNRLTFFRQSQNCIWIWLWDVLVLWTLGPGTMGPSVTWTLGFLDFRTLGPLPSSTTSYLFLLLHCFGMVWFGKGGWVGEMNYSMVPTLKPWDLLLPSTFSTSNLLPLPSTYYYFVVSTRVLQVL